MSFFEPQPPRTPPEPPADPSPWFGEPRRLLGGIVGTRVVLAMTADTAVLFKGVTAFADGVSFTVHLLPRPGSSHAERQLDFGLVMQPHYTDGELSPSFFRFGIELDDGTKLTNLTSDFADPPDHPVLRTQGGSGSDQEFHLRFWLWPLPTGATLDLVCEWPVAGIRVSRARIETAPILAAAATARAYWRGGT